MNGLIELVGQYAALQEQQAASGVGQTASGCGPLMLPAFETGTDLFPRGQVASSDRPRSRSGLNAIEARLQAKEKDLDLAATLYESAVALHKSGEEAEQARRELEAFRAMVERRMISSMGNRGLRRRERHEDNAHQFEMDRRWHWERDLDRHWDQVNWRQVEQRLRDLNQ